MFLSDRLIPETIKYNPRAGRYIRNGAFVAEREIDALAIIESNILATQLERVTQKLIEGNIDIPAWENQFANTLKKSHIRMTILASGGWNRTGLNSYGIAGRRLKGEYRYLHNFAIALSEGKLSAKQALARARLYGQSTVQTYYDSFHFNKKREGFKLAWRSLDPIADHCSDCPSLATNGYVPIEQVTPKGARCACRGRCRCQIRYRKI